MSRVLLLLLVLLIPPVATAEGRVPQGQAEIALSFAPVVKAATPAVVNIYTARVVARQVSPFAADPFFSQFFGGFGQPVPQVQSALGSGVIVGAEGVVVSNYHVVGEADEIRVVLADRREFDARVVLADKDADLAVLRLDGASDLPTLPLADSDEVEVGDLVLAIGNPFGVGQTVSSGIVSGLARGGSGLAGGPGYMIQTDAPINPGNSGGALVDMSGRLVGINTSILSRSGGSNGIGFAIPANLVAEFVAQARSGRDSFVRPWSGISVQPVDSDLYAVLGLDRPGGVLVRELHPQSPFARAGVTVGDVILDVDGAPVGGQAELGYRLTEGGLGGTATVHVLGQDGARDIVIDLAEAPDDPPARPTRLRARGPLDGLTVANVNPRMIAELGLPLVARGVVVTEAGGTAARLGFRPGDILKAVNGRAIETTGDALAAARRPAPAWDIEIEREGRRISTRFRG